MYSRFRTRDYYLRLMIVATLALSSMVTSCEDEKRYYVQNMADGDHTPTMSTIDVRTFISDSGYTKYYITAPIWDMYEDATDPFWKFPQGVNLEQYDDNGNVAATLRCDTAHYLSQRRIWQLDRNIVMVNQRNDTFLTNQVFWDQSRHKIYSDSFIHIVQAARVIEGYGFESNENMTAYTVNRPTGIFPVNRQRESQTSSASAVDESDEMRRAPAPPRASQHDQMFRFGPN